MKPWLFIPFDLSIPWCIDRRNPEVQAEVEAARNLPLTTIPAKFDDHRSRDAETQAFAAMIEAEKKTKVRGKSANNKARTDHESTWVPGATWDTMRSRWVQPGEAPKPNTARDTQDLSIPPRRIKARVTATGRARVQKSWATRRAKQQQEESTR
jgi:hypothetical protein